MRSERSRSRLLSEVTSFLRPSPPTASADRRRLPGRLAVVVATVPWVVGLAPVAEPAISAAQSVRAVVTTIARGDQGAVTNPAIDELAVVRAGSVVEEPVTVPLDLFTGDELRAVSGALIVELDCRTADAAAGDQAATVTSAGSGRLTFSEPFRVVVMPAASATCAFNLLSGTVQAVTDNQDTEITVGDTTAGSPHTQWGMRATRDRGRLVEEVFVFDGTVEVRRLADSRDVAMQVNAGTVFNGEARSVRTIDAIEFDRAATTLAAVDVARADFSAPQRQGAFGALKAGYLDVLRAPEEPSARLGLIAQQLNYSTVSWNTLYQIEQAESREPADAGDRAVLEVAKGMVYEKLGNAAGAQQLYRDAMQQRDEDQIKAFNDAVVKYRINEELLRERAIVLPPSGQGGRAGDLATTVDPAAVQGVSVDPTLPALTVQAQASPARVRASQYTRVIVDVTDANGRPVVGAEVLVEAGGGTFPDGETAVKGTTDAEGRFVTRWSCRPCAASYRMNITVAMDGYSMAQERIEVAIAGSRRP